MSAVQVETSCFGHKILASCPWGPVTANGVDLLTKLYVIYMETHTSHRAIAFGLSVHYAKINLVNPIQMHYAVSPMLCFSKKHTFNLLLFFVL